MTKFLLVSLACLLMTPVALAHNTVETDDGAYFLTIGHRSEPTATYLRSGLDLIVRVNDDGERGDEVPDLADKLDATLISPSGEEMSQILTVQHGAVGRYSFADPYVLTEPGQYQLRLTGTIGETAVDGTYDVSGPLANITDLTFPSTEVPTLLELQDRITMMEMHMDAMMDSMKDDDAMSNEEEPTGQFSPGPGIWAVIGLLGLMVLRRR